MTLEVELNPQQEAWLTQAAARDGVDQRTALLEALERQRVVEDPLIGISNNADQLQIEITRPLPAEIIERHRQLSRKRQEETLTAEENRELIELIDITEVHHAARLARVLKLAQLQGKDFELLLQQFGLLQIVR